MLWITAKEGGKTITEIASSAHVSRNTVYKWLNRFDTGGINNLVPKTPGAKTGTHSLAIPRSLVAKIIDLYEDDFGIRSIVRVLGKEGISVSHMTVYRYLVSRGKIVPVRKRKRSKFPKLHVCDYPGEEVQLDVMHVDPIAGTGDPKGRSRQGFHYQYTLVDDCTRVQYARLFENLSQNHTCEFLEEVVSRSPFLLAKVRMDNGLEFQSKVRSFLEQRQISYVYNRPSRPDMNGKVERTHRIDTEEFYLKDASKSFDERQSGLAKYVSFFDNERPHFGFGMDGKTPLEKLQSFKEYQSVHLIV